MNKMYNITLEEFDFASISQLITSCIKDIEHAKKLFRCDDYNIINRCLLTLSAISLQCVLLNPELSTQKEIESATQALLYLKKGSEKTGLLIPKVEKIT